MDDRKYHDLYSTTDPDNIDNDATISEKDFMSFRHESPREQILDPSVLITWRDSPMHRLESVSLPESRYYQLPVSHFKIKQGTADKEAFNEK